MTSIYVKASGYVYILWLTASLAVAGTVQGQCTVIETQRPDGLTGYQASDYFTGPVASNAMAEVALMPSIIGDMYHTLGFVVWRSVKKRITGPIRIVLEDGTALQLELIEFQDFRAEARDLTTGLYSNSRDGTQRLSKSPIRLINLNIDGSWAVFRANSRKTEFVESLHCLRRETEIPFK